MSAQPVEAIEIHGARCHNLKNIDVTFPHQRLTVVTGVSGSGKSSLVFDTVHSEGQRRFLENLSPATRQLFSQMSPPNVDQISGLPPTISIEQTPRTQSKRSTLATLTEVYDYFRLLYAQLGTVHCTNCGQPLHQQSAAQIVDLLLALEDRQKVIILAPVVSGKQGKHAALLEKIVKEGFVRARVDGEILDVTRPPELDEHADHDIEIVIDRIIVKAGIEARLKESVDLALKQGSGACYVSQQTEQGWSDRYLSTRLACGKCNLSFPDPEPRSFSFNSPYGACPACDGLGVLESDSAEETASVCPDCGGARVNAYARSILLGELSIDQVVQQAPPEVILWLDAWQTNTEGQSTPKEREVAGQLLPPILSRLRYLEEIGLGYLQLARPVRTLSGGELQRARLAACLGSQTTGACYILDEPTAGLHARETTKLLAILNRLKTAGNTVIVVEHDLDLIKAGDLILDLGPGAGEAGGEVVASGTYQDVIQNERSFTARALRHEYQFQASTPSSNAGPQIRLKGARLHNLKDVTLELPLEQLACVTGVSGCGKSSLVMETLVPALKAALRKQQDQSPHYDSLEGFEQLQQVKTIDQSPIGRSGRSNPATFCGIWDEVRKLFARTKTARLRGYTATRFSFNSKQGRCATCQGQGYRRVDLQFLPSLYLPCEMCDTKRFNRQTLAVKYREKDVSDLLEMSLEEAAQFLQAIPKISDVLNVLIELGLGYLALGQPANMLSGGEAQRLKLARELLTRSPGKTLFVLDEPTRGLHVKDIDRLLAVLRRLVGEGNSVLFIEHQPQAIIQADWLIELGPEGGAAGGYIIDAGTPRDLASRNAGPTGTMLSELIAT